MSDNRMNCWEFKQCGREPGGSNIEKYGSCSVPVSVEHNGINNGKNGGRSCWILREAACEKIMRACRVDEIKECRQCRFHIHVKKSERFPRKIIRNKAYRYSRSILMSLYKVTGLSYER
ncbi:MAG: two-CW domain-containing protein [Candidatus Electrothrix aestuarii]|uniref:Two-CW domain-containing protein n=1 Tax=Candidatus Electrothrix aestuarii TaxID=3062594 RepID=A0AAU8M287_9BACT